MAGRKLCRASLEWGVEPQKPFLLTGVSVCHSLPSPAWPWGHLLQRMTSPHCFLKPFCLRNSLHLDIVLRSSSSLYACCSVHLFSETPCSCQCCCSCPCPFVCWCTLTIWFSMGNLFSVFLKGYYSLWTFLFLS